MPECGVDEGRGVGCFLDDVQGDKSPGFTYLIGIYESLDSRSSVTDRPDIVSDPGRVKFAGIIMLTEAAPRGLDFDRSKFLVYWIADRQINVRRRISLGVSSLNILS